MYYTMNNSVTVVITSGTVMILHDFDAYGWHVSSDAPVPWMLIEPGVSRESIPTRILHPRFFYVVFAPPAESMVEIFCQHPFDLRRWIMSPWTTEELFMLYVEQSLRCSACANSELFLLQDKAWLPPSGDV